MKCKLKENWLESFFFVLFYDPVRRKTLPERINIFKSFARVVAKKRGVFLLIGWRRSFCFNFNVDTFLCACKQCRSKKMLNKKEQKL